MANKKGSMKLLKMDGVSLSIGYHKEKNRITLVSYDEDSHNAVQFGKFNDEQTADAFLQVLNLVIGKVVNKFVSIEPVPEITEEDVKN